MGASKMEKIASLNLDVLLNCRHIEIIHTRPKIVIFTKLDPKTGGCQTWHILPLSPGATISGYNMHI
jgi:hypothetical protein